MPKTDRRHSTAEEKTEIIQRHLVDRVPVSDLCDEYKIAPSIFYSSQKHALEAMSSALEHGARRNANNESWSFRKSECRSRRHIEAAGKRSKNIWNTCVRSLRLEPRGTLS